MQGSKELKKQKSKGRGCKALCCTRRLSVSSSEEAESLLSDRFPRVSSLAHAMVQERLDQMIRERDEERYEERKRSARRENTKFIIMVAIEKSSYDPREDFRESIVEMIRVNNMYKVNDLRQLLNCYISMNPEEYRGVILEVFHEERERGERTLLEFLRERMDGAARVERRRSLKERLGLNGIRCCGAYWGLGPISVLEDEQGPQQEPLIPAQLGMNLATALAAERQFRAGQESPMGPEISGPDIGPAQNRISLMRLLHETECEDIEREDIEKIGVCDTVCCVCMGRKKGAAFIPCGHTFCRVCSRELWLNRGSCPLCNRPILEILDIF